jgi:hypothetical protein
MLVKNDRTAIMLVKNDYVLWTDFDAAAGGTSAPYLSAGVIRELMGSYAYVEIEDGVIVEIHPSRLKWIGYLDPKTKILTFSIRKVRLW